MTEKDTPHLLEEIKRTNKDRRATALAQAKAEAVTNGKEPFDFSVLETDAIPEVLNGIDSERRVAYWEHWYFVLNPRLRTMQELVENINQLAGY